jgi:hypothetical protein
MKRRYQRRNNPDTHHKDRDGSYDKGAHYGAPETIYTTFGGAGLVIKREVAACHACGKVTDLINNYCAVCRGNCANEAQCLNPRTIRVSR